MTYKLPISAPITVYLNILVETYYESKEDPLFTDNMDDIIRDDVTNVLKELIGLSEDSDVDLASSAKHKESVVYVKERLALFKPEDEFEDVPKEKLCADGSVDVNGGVSYDLKGRASLTRVSHYAGVLALATTIRQRFWNNPDPPITDWHVVDLELAVKIAKRKLTQREDSGQGYVVETIVYSKDEDGGLPAKRPDDAVRLSVEDLDPILLGDTAWGYELALMVRAFRAKYEPPWLDERQIGLLLLTGYLPPLDNLTFSYGVNQGESEFSRPWAQITIHDLEGVSQKDLLQTHKFVTEKVADLPDEPFKYRSQGNGKTPKKTRRGRPVSDLDEALAFLELDLLLNKARERVEANESVAPSEWEWRPSNSELNEAWLEDGWIRYRDNFRDDDSNLLRPSLSAQKLRQFRLTVPRDTYLPALLQFFSEKDVAALKAGSDADRALALDFATFWDNTSFDELHAALDKQVKPRPNFYTEFKNVRSTPMWEPPTRPLKVTGKHDIDKSFSTLWTRGILKWDRSG